MGYHYPPGHPQNPGNGSSSQSNTNSSRHGPLVSDWRRLPYSELNAEQRRIVDEMWSRESPRMQELYKLMKNVHEMMFRK